MGLLDILPDGIWRAFTVWRCDQTLATTFQLSIEPFFPATGQMSEITPAELSFVLAKITAKQTDANALTDAVFHRRHPDRGGRAITKGEAALTKEWLNIREQISELLLDSNKATGSSVPGMPGVTIQQLVEKWRLIITPDIPSPVLLAFIRLESGGNFNDATHGSRRNVPPYTQPAFYELGLFQTPAGQHGTCSSDYYQSCEQQPPGREVPGDPSSWVRLCKLIGADPKEWANPVTQVRVGLLDLRNSKDIISAAYPDLFPKPGSDWHLRAAVLLPFARGGGFSKAFLTKYRADLAKLSDESKWEFLRGKKVGRYTFDPANVDKKMALAAKLGYRP